MAQVNRRHALATLGTMATIGSLSPLASCALADAKGGKTKICAFVKFIQEMPYKKMAATLAAMGFDGVEATIRKGGLVAPEQAVDELPKLHEALKKHGMEITVMASDINDPDDPINAKVMKTAQQLGVKRYRMKYFRYTTDSPVEQQLVEFRKRAENLAAANREYKLQALYQNHAGTRYVGATLWDLRKLLEGISPAEIGIAFDIRHATATGGETWPVLWDVALPHVQAIYAKDFHWAKPPRAERGAKQRMENVPLGQGQVDSKFFRTLPADWSHPISLHVEYLGKAGLEKNLAALKTDLTTLRGWLG